MVIITFYLRGLYTMFDGILAKYVMRLPALIRELKDHKK